MSSSPLDIDTVAAGLLAELGIGAVAPIDLDLVVRRLGVQVRYRRLPAAHGMLWLDAERPVIVVDDRAPRPRARFTIGHEIGHLMLARPGFAHAELCRTQPSLADVERFCDRFAESLLLPSGWTRSYIDGRDPGFATLLELSRTADVSLSAASVRLARVAHWKRTLLRLKRNAQRWSLSAVTGYLRPGWRDGVHPTAAAAALLHDLRNTLPKLYTGHAPFVIHGRPWMVPIEARVANHSAVVLADLLRLLPLTERSAPAPHARRGSPSSDSPFPHTKGETPHVPDC